MPKSKGVSRKVRQGGPSHGATSRSGMHAFNSTTSRVYKLKAIQQDSIDAESRVATAVAGRSRSHIPRSALCLTRIQASRLRINRPLLTCAGTTHQTHKMISQRSSYQEASQTSRTTLPTHPQSRVRRQIRASQLKIRSDMPFAIFWTDSTPHVDLYLYPCSSL